MKTKKIIKNSLLLLVIMLMNIIKIEGQIYEAAKIVGTKKGKVLVKMIAYEPNESMLVIKINIKRITTKTPEDIMCFSKPVYHYKEQKILLLVGVTSFNYNYYTEKEIHINGMEPFKEKKIVFIKITSLVTIQELFLFYVYDPLSETLIEELVRIKKK